MARKKTPKAQKKTSSGAVQTDQIRIVSLEPIPDIFIDGFLGVLVTGGNVKINLYSDALDLVKEEAIRRIVGRLTMSTSVLVQFHQSLGTAIDGLKKDDIIQTKESEK